MTLIYTDLKNRPGIKRPQPGAAVPHESIRRKLTVRKRYRGARWFCQDGRIPIDASY